MCAFCVVPIISKTEKAGKNWKKERRRKFSCLKMWNQ